ncbi:hypothetical protein PRZ48_010650 [Zasmidium cellare]|uniref:Uncharacterized protein n=1 Tax=Zasmidium cellare TaxID=395010 RepID=A0ABR0E978_ZASCE|nr:hypothetical protein PRZ48_010650 [Zasmidium cellare]
MHLKTYTRRQHINRLLSLPLPQCTSFEWRQEYYRILWMMRELLDCGTKDARSIWKMNLLAEALQKLHEIDDPTSTPTESYKKDNNRWTEVMTRRIIAEQLWDEGGVVTFYDCWDTLREGRSKAAAARLHEQVRICWQGVTDADVSTDFSLTA